MQATQTKLQGVIILEPRTFSDDRGYFFESFNATTFAKLTGLTVQFVQDNHSHSRRGVIRGLHYQHQHPQGKLVRVTAGEVLDVAVDLRKSAPTFGQWVGVLLSAQNRRQLWIPAGFAHGFSVLSDSADFMYKTTDFWHPEDEYCIRFDDAKVAIDWHLSSEPVVSAKDLQGQEFGAARTFD